MAQIGLEYVVCAPLNEAGTAYEPGSVICAAIKADMKINFNTVELWADNKKRGSITDFKDGKLSFSGDYLSYETRSLLLGHEHDPQLDDIEGGERLVSRTGDEGRFVGIGYISETWARGVRKYRAIWINKVKFSETGETLETKNGSAKFQTPTLEGDILPDEDKVFRDEVLVSSFSAAKEWLNAKAGITEETGGA